jgi:hypothetical protein
VKVGDLVMLQNSPAGWSDIALITNIVISESNTGTISLYTSSLGDCSVPWHKSDVYIREVLSEAK